MKTVIYKNLPACARELRQKVFVKEQGFRDEFDEIDATAVHLVLFADDGAPAATCRIFRSEEEKTYILGRLAVAKERRGQKLGSALLKEAENYVRIEGGRSVALHAQCRRAAFYEKAGYEKFGAVADDEGCPHIWMKKEL